MFVRLSWLAASLMLAVGMFLGSGLPASADVVETVDRGENLYRIALRYGVSVEAIVRHNGLASPDRIYVGQALTIPGPAGGVAAPSAAAPRPAESAPSGGGTALHIVAPGENLFRIALRYGSSAQALARLNGLGQADVIFAGQRLIVPRAADASGLAGVGGAPVAAVGRRIVIDLSDQRLYAYEGGALVNSFVVSSGKRSTPTPVGDFQVYTRYPSQDMSGPGYYAPAVPWVQYFTGPYALHGTYWHNSFGLPVSHGCVNLRTPDAQWLYFWARMGTPVRVQW